MRFKIHQESYIDDKIIPEGTELTVAPIGRNADGTPKYIHPGPHWEPMDADAKEYCESVDHAFTGEVPDAVPLLADELEKRMAADRNGIDGKALGSAIAEGMLLAQASQASQAAKVNTALAQPRR